MKRAHHLCGNLSKHLSPEFSHKRKISDKSKLGGVLQNTEYLEKGTTEDEMAGWPHRLDGREFE